MNVILTAERTCPWCGVSINHMGSRAVYCSRQHKENAAALRFRERNPGYYKRYVGSTRYEAWLEDTREDRTTRARERRRTNGPTPGEHAANVAWRVANKDRLRRNQRNYVARKWANSDSVDVAHRDWVRLCRRYDNRCAYCGVRPDTALQMEHVIPLTRGGRHGIGNILPACFPCNGSKNSLLLIEWRVRDHRHPPGKGH